MPARIELPYKPFPKQELFHGSAAKYRLFGGAAGPGKSKALLMEAVMQALENPGANTLVLRRTFAELEQSLLLYFRRDIPREYYSSFNETKHVVTWRNGSTTRFGYCQSENDVYQYQGAEYLFIGVDELTLFTLRQWQFLTSRNRCPVPGTFPCMAGATNPGNIGHTWVKALWIDKQPAAGMENPEQYDPSDYDFVPARLADNPIYAGDENYRKSLNALPSELRRAFLDGDWDVFAGQYFDRFDVSRHVLRAEAVDWKPWWPRWISLDWGFEHPAAAYWHTSAPGLQNADTAARQSQERSFDYDSRLRFAKEEKGARVSAQDDNVAGQAAQPPLNQVSCSSLVIPNEVSAHFSSGPAQPGRAETQPRNLSSYNRSGTAQPAPKSTVVTYREFVTHRTAPRDLARELVARSRAFDGAAEKIDAIYLSPDAFARRTDEASIAEQMGDVFAAAGLPRPIPADNDRIGGWMLMYQMLDAGEWIMTENCVELIRTIPTLVRDMARVEDIEKMDGDDPADAARYGLKSRYATRAATSIERLPYEARLAARAVSADPTVRAIQARKAQIEESHRSQPVSFLRRRR